MGQSRLYWGPSRSMHYINSRIHDNLGWVKASKKSPFSKILSWNYSLEDEMLLWNTLTYNGLTDSIVRKSEKWIGEAWIEWSTTTLREKIDQEIFDPPNTTSSIELLCGVGATNLKKVALVVPPFSNTRLFFISHNDHCTVTVKLLHAFQSGSVTR